MLVYISVFEVFVNAGALLMGVSVDGQHHTYLCYSRRQALELLESFTDILPAVRTACHGMLPHLPKVLNPDPVIHIEGDAAGLINESMASPVLGDGRQSLVRVKMLCSPRPGVRTIAFPIHHTNDVQNSPGAVMIINVDAGIEIVVLYSRRQVLELVERDGAIWDDPVRRTVIRGLRGSVLPVESNLPLTRIVADIAIILTAQFEAWHGRGASRIVFREMAPGERGEN